MSPASLAAGAQSRVGDPGPFSGQVPLELLVEPDGALVPELLLEVDDALVAAVADEDWELAPAEPELELAASPLDPLEATDPDSPPEELAATLAPEDPIPEVEPEIERLTVEEPPAPLPAS
jgi:hypothetical protein